VARLMTASDRAFLVVFDDAITAVAGREVRTLEAWLRDEPPDAIVDLNPAYASLLVRFGPLALRPPTRCPSRLLRRVASLDVRPERTPRSFEVPVRYGWGRRPRSRRGRARRRVERGRGRRGPRGRGLRGPVHRVFPRFPYLAGLPDRLRTPRKEAPRTRVPGGSVAIAGAQAGIYPLASPGGWNVIGRTSLVLFDRAPGRGATLAAGDRLRFIPVERLP